MDEITDELLDSMVEKWTAIGLSTEPTDRARAEAGMALAYKAAGLVCPTQIIWFASPLAGQLAISWLAEAKDEEDLYIKVATGSPGKGKYISALGSHFDAGWLGFYDTFRSAGLKEETEDLVGLMEVAQAAGWWWPFENLVVATDRPISMHLDATGQLHNESGPAISYADRFSLYYWHGVALSEGMLDPNNTPPTEVLMTSNAEVRRALIEIRGAGVFLTEVQAKLRQEDKFGKIYDIPGDNTLAICEVINSTAEFDGHHKVYHLLVPKRMRSAHEAVARSFGLDPSEYRPQVQS